MTHQHRIAFITPDIQIFLLYTGVEIKAMHMTLTSSLSTLTNIKVIFYHVCYSQFKNLGCVVISTNIVLFVKLQCLF